jgi:3-oxoacyl-[acyl-carrier protein] reductase
MQIEGKAAIVTGGGTGVGRATALALGRGGCSVLVNYSRSKDAAEQTVSELKSLGVNAVAEQADVTDDAAVRRMVRRAVEAFGGLHILVNNAGHTRFIPATCLDEVTDEDWDRILAVNVKGPFHCSRAAKDAIVAAGGGEIVNVSSVAAELASGSSIPYCASKAALNNVTVALARVLAPEIRVNGVAPGFIAGDWLRRGLGPLYEPVKAAFEQQLPLGQVCSAEDVAGAILGLIAGPDSVTGHTLVCDGGMTIIAPVGVSAAK